MRAGPGRIDDDVRAVRRADDARQRLRRLRRGERQAENAGEGLQLVDAAGAEQIAGDGDDLAAAAMRIDDQLRGDRRLADAGRADQHQRPRREAILERLKPERSVESGGQRGGRVLSRECRRRAIEAAGERRRYAVVRQGVADLAFRLRRTRLFAHPAVERRLVRVRPVHRRDDANAAAAALALGGNDDGILAQLAADLPHRLRHGRGVEGFEAHGVRPRLPDPPS